MTQELPQALLDALAPKAPKLTRLLRSFVDDPRDWLDIDNVMVRLYWATGEVPKRSTVTQQLHDAAGRGFITRKARGLYGITEAGRGWLAEAEERQRLT